MAHMILGHLKVNNVPAIGDWDGRYMVVRLVDGELWYYGIYDEEERANAAVDELGNAFIFRG